MSLTRRTLSLMPLAFTALALTASEHRALRRQVLLMGRKSPSSDGSYASFIKAMRKVHAKLTERLDFRFVDVENRAGHDPAAALRRALEFRPDLLLAPNGEFAKLATEVSGGVPIVFSSYVHPVQAGFATSMLRREAAITGVWVSEHLDGKRLELLRDAYPAIQRVGVMMDASWRQLADRLAPVEAAARDLGMTAQVFVVETAEEAQAVLDEPSSRDFDGWVLPRSYMAVLATPLIIKRLREWKKPLIVGNTADVRNGAAMSYATDTRFIWPSLATLAGRVLAGEHAGRIPIQRPQRYVLALRAGRDTGLPPPSAEVVRQADLVFR
ncbi:ABC transporter substrate binding protein [Roseateles sp. DC23W]|uniref:ABC transporter substrate binding protein n=1 Tax=Pelomonas dachongensis TaxID=3299029 RepID=A0ABW7EJM3_9BURK